MFLSVVVTAAYVTLITLSLSVTLMEILIPGTLGLVRKGHPLHFLVTSNYVVTVVILTLDSTDLGIAGFG